MPIKSDKHLVELGFRVAQSSPAILSYWDKNLICRYANEAYLEWFGLKPEDMIDKMLLETLLGHMYKSNLSHIAGVFRGKKQIFERSMITPSGITKQGRVTYIPDIVNGIVIGYYVQVVDISPIATLVNNFSEEEFNKLPSPLLLNSQVLDGVLKTLKSSLFTEFPGISKIAKMHFISKSKLKKDFKEKFGTTIFSYFRNLQMEVAEEKIATQGFSKTQMAMALNFSNPSNFFSCYKKYLRQKEITQVIDKLKKESKERYKAFIEELPYEIAILDNHLNYIAASRLWLVNKHINDIDYIGGNIYEISPGAKEKFKKFIDYFLERHTNSNESEPIEGMDGTLNRIKWDIRQWYATDKEIGGLIVMTKDFSNAKLKDAESKQLSEVIEKMSDTVKFGVWA